MPRHKKARSSPWTLRRSINDALASDGDSMRPLVLSGNDNGGKQRKVVMVSQPVSRVASVKDNLLKIQQLANPIDFLIRVQNGELIPVQIVNDNGDIATAYQSASLEDRIIVAKFMASKILPTLNVIKHITETDTSPDENPIRNGRASFAQIVSAAAARAANMVYDVSYSVEEEVGEAAKDGGQTDDSTADTNPDEQPDRQD